MRKGLPYRNLVLICLTLALYVVVMVTVDFQKCWYFFMPTALVIILIGKRNSIPWSMFGLLTWVLTILNLGFLAPKLFENPLVFCVSILLFLALLLWSVVEFCMLLFSLHKSLQQLTPQARLERAIREARKRCEEADLRYSDKGPSVSSH